MGSILRQLCQTLFTTRRLLILTLGDMVVLQTPTNGLVPGDPCAAAQAVRDAGIASVAVVLKHSYIFGEHEEAVGALARELGFTQVLPLPGPNIQNIQRRGMLCPCIDVMGALMSCPYHTAEAHADQRHQTQLIVVQGAAHACAAQYIAAA